MTINVKAKNFRLFCFHTETTNDGVLSLLSDSSELDELEELECEFCVSAGVAAYLTRSSAKRFHQTKCRQTSFVPGILLCERIMVLISSIFFGSYFSLVYNKLYLFVHVPFIRLPETLSTFENRVHYL